MFSTPEGFTNNGPMSPGSSVTVKKPIASKLLSQFYEVSYAKQNTDVCMLGYVKSKHKAIRAGSMLCSNIPNSRVHKKINERV